MQLLLQNLGKIYTNNNFRFCSLEPDGWIIRFFSLLYMSYVITGVVTIINLWPR